MIICILAVGIIFVRQQQEKNRKKEDIVTIHTGDDSGMHVEVDCYPILHGQLVKVEDKELIATLAEEIDGKVFSYLSSIKELDKKFEGYSRGYYSNFRVYSKNGNMLYSFGYNGYYDGYTVTRNSFVTG